MRGKKKEEVLTPEEKLRQALVPESEWPYKVPGNWQWTRIECINRYDSGSIDPSKEPALMYELYSVPSSADDYPEVLAGQDIGSTKQEVEKGDVLLCKINPRINRVWKVSQHTENKLLASSEWIIIRNENILADYLMYCFRSPYFRDYMLSNVSGVGGSLMRAQPKFVKSYPLPIPPLPEQRRIVDRIESLFAKLDEAKEKAQAVVDGFENRKAAILHKAFTGKLTEGWRKENKIPFSDWCNDVLEKRFEIVGGIQKKPGRTPNNNPVPYITVANVYRNHLELTDLRFFELFEGELERYQLQYADILIVEGNGSGNEIGRCAMWKDELPVCVHQNHIIRIRRKDKSVLPEYVLYFLNSSKGKCIMKDRAKTTAGLYNLSTGKIKTIPVPFAPIEEQRVIVQILDKALYKEQQAKDSAEQVIAQIDTMKKSILAHAFRGELGTNDPSDESAEELLKRIL